MLCQLPEDDEDDGDGDVVCLLPLGGGDLPSERVGEPPPWLDAEVDIMLCHPPDDDDDEDDDGACACKLCEGVATRPAPPW